MTRDIINDLQGFFDALDRRITEECEGQGILRKDIAKKLGYSSGSGLTMAIRRGTLKMWEFAKIAGEIGILSFEVWPDELREYMREQPMLKIFLYVEHMRQDDRVAEAYRILRSRGGGSKEKTWR